jgi:peptidoglycan hydrolase-like protein with peptidoglycan-binding domain
VSRALIAGGGAVTVALVVAGAVALTGGDGAPPAAAAAPPVGATATVERGDLAERDSLDGTLGYADDAALVAGVDGTLTRLRDPGAIVRRGESLYSVDGRAAAWLLYGELPAWRDFAPGMEDGEDVRQLERNLRALGADPDGDLTVDGEWDWATTAAVERFQDERGMEETGTLTRGQVLFRPGPSRIGAASLAVGQETRPGQQIGRISSTRREVTVDLDATRQSLARAGDAVTVELPTGRTARGRITDVGKVAEPPSEEGGDATIPVTIGLRGKVARGSGLDQAPVDVGFEVERAEGVLTVPVKALLARQGGGFAVQLAGSGRIVPVEPGLYADDLVEVGGDLSEGDTVVTAR